MIQAPETRDLSQETEPTGDGSAVPAIRPDMRDTILTKLRRIEEDEGVRILFAVESGSRAWGFPSPDSDYDARFVYVHPIDWYLSLKPGRDVIELPIEGLLDINGWDIQKALALLLKPNPVLLEWLSSPLRYIWDDDICQRLIAFSQKITHGRACLYHYLHLGEGQWSTHIEGKEQVSLKKYFYIVRPALALRWIRLHPDIIPPMNLQALIAGVDLPGDLLKSLDRLLVEKSRSREVGIAPRILEIDQFITSEFERAREAVAEDQAPPVDISDEADRLFREILETH